MWAENVMCPLYHINANGLGRWVEWSGVEMRWVESKNCDFKWEVALTDWFGLGRRWSGVETTGPGPGSDRNFTWRWSYLLSGEVTVTWRFLLVYCSVPVKTGFTWSSIYPSIPLRYYGLARKHQLNIFILYFNLQTVFGKILKLYFNNVTELLSTISKFQVG